VILALAASLRLPLVFSGLPYISYIDEGGVLHPVMRLVRSNGWDPGWYQYPSLSMYLTAAVLHASRPIYRLVHGRPLAEDVPPEGDLYDLIGPPELILAGRGVVVAASLVTVLVGMALARRIAGRSAAIAALLAMTPALVQRACIVITDTVSAAFVAGVLLAAEDLRSILRKEGPSSIAARRHALFAGALAGLAAATKYPAGAVFVVILVSVFAPGGLSFERVRLAGLSALAAILSTLIAMPAIVFRTRQVAAGLVAQAHDYATFGTTHSLFGQALDPEELGWLLTLCGLLGLVVLALRRETRSTVVGWLAFGVLLLAPLLRYGFQPFRNALLLVPPFVVAASCLFGDRFPFARWRGARVLAASVLLVGLAPGLLDAWRMRRHTDSRVRLVDELSKPEWKGKRALVQRELAILPAELARAACDTEVAPWEALPPLAESGRYDLIVLGRFDDRMVPPPEWVARAQAFEARAGSFPVVAVFGSRRTPVYPNYWRDDDELLIFARLAPAGGGTS
jgi:hypothetical protein